MQISLHGLVNLDSIVVNIFMVYTDKQLKSWRAIFRRTLMQLQLYLPTASAEASLFPFVLSAIASSLARRSTVCWFVGELILK